MNICVCGYYGMGNFGDELFLRTWKQIFSEHTVFPWSIYLETSQFDAVIVGGGDLITPYYYNAYYVPPELANLPTWVYGVGIVDTYSKDTWPLEHVLQYKDFFNRVKGLYVRDHNSARILEQSPFHLQPNVVPDIVFAYDQPRYPVSRNQNRKRIGVCLYAYDDFPYQKMVKVFADLTRKGYELWFIPVVNQSNNKFSDYSMCLKVRNAVLEENPQAILSMPYCEYDLEMTYSVIQSMDYLISFKLHPSIAAIRNQVPVLSLSKMNKVKFLLQAFGLEEYFCDYDRPVEDIQGVLEQFLQTSKDKLEMVHSLVQEMETRSKESLLEIKREIVQTVSK